jgi:chorismate mutase/prephenate dehydratase
LSGGEQTERRALSDDRSDTSEARVLGELREAIDAVDHALLDGLNERARLVQRVGELKRTRGLSVYSAGRERDLAEALIAANSGPFPDAALLPVFREIVSGTRSLERELRVGYLGPDGTFSHLAARESFGACAQYVPVASFAEVLASVASGQLDHGLLPVENSTEGVVTQALDCLVDSNVTLVGEVLLRISLCLMSQAGDLAGVRRIASHPQPLAQARGWLDRELPNADRIEVASTAEAARLAAEAPDVAAIGTELAAEVGGLTPISRGIEDRHDNTTRFLIVGGEAPEPSGFDLTSVVFTVRKDQSGALHRLLSPFADNGVNLAAIQARPLKGAPWEYLFFIDAEGHRDEPAMARAIEASGEVALSTRILGSFPRARRPRGGEIA